MTKDKIINIEMAEKTKKNIKSSLDILKLKGKNRELVKVMLEAVFIEGVYKGIEKTFMLINGREKKGDVN